MSEAHEPRRATAADFASAPITIAGAGIAGLAAAIALAGKGLRVVVLERAGTPRETGAGIQLSPNAVQVLARLGLSVPLLDIAVRPRSVEIRSGETGGLLGEVPLAGAAEERYGAPYCVLARPALHRLLTEAAIRAGAVIRYASEVEGFEPVPGGILVHLAGAPPVMASTLVGADGLWSHVRARLWRRDEPVSSGRIAWRATIAPEAIPASFAPANVVTAWLVPRAHAVTYPIDAAGTHNLVVVTEGEIAGEGWDVGADAQVLAARTAGFAPPLRDIITAAGDWRAWTLFRTRPAFVGWGSDAITLIGDAAHPMLPFAAQGAAMAIEDAWVLAERIAGGEQGMSRALRAYERARLRRVGRVTSAALRNGWVFQLGGPLAGVRDRVLRARSGPRLLDRLDWLYGGGPASHAGHAHSGAR